MLPSILEPTGSSKEYRRNWARLIQKIREVDPLTCTKCQGKMRIIAFIEDEEVIEKILKHLGLWEVKPRPSPGTQAAAEKTETIIDDSFSQLPAPARRPFGGSDKYLYVDPQYPEVYTGWFLEKQMGSRANSTQILTRSSGLCYLCPSWPQPSIPGSQLPPQSRLRREG